MGHPRLHGFGSGGTPVPSVSPATRATSHPLENVVIRAGGLDHPDVVCLLQTHLESMHANSPACSVHALALDGLRDPSIRFWTAWRSDCLLGCAALRTLDVTHGELKSMRTAAAHLRQGVAARLLAHIVQEATARGMQRLSLETGSGDAFLAAQNLYARLGFEPCGPFGDYKADPHSVYMTRRL